MPHIGAYLNPFSAQFKSQSRLSQSTLHPVSKAAIWAISVLAGVVGVLPGIALFRLLVDRFTPELKAGPQQEAAEKTTQVSRRVLQGTNETLFDSFQRKMNTQVPIQSLAAQAVDLLTQDGRAYTDDNPLTGIPELLVKHADLDPLVQALTGEMSELPIEKQIQAVMLFSRAPELAAPLFGWYTDHLVKQGHFHEAFDFLLYGNQSGLLGEVAQCMQEQHFIQKFEIAFTALNAMSSNPTQAFEHFKTGIMAFKELGQEGDHTASSLWAEVAVDLLQNAQFSDDQANISKLLQDNIPKDVLVETLVNKIKHLEGEEFTRVMEGFKAHAPALQLDLLRVSYRRIADLIMNFSNNTIVRNLSNLLSRDPPLPREQIGKELAQHIDRLINTGEPAIAKCVLEGVYGAMPDLEEQITSLCTNQEFVKGVFASKRHFANAHSAFLRGDADGVLTELDAALGASVITGKDLIVASALLLELPKEKTTECLRILQTYVDDDDLVISISDLISRSEFSYESTINAIKADNPSFGAQIEQKISQEIS